MKLIVDMTNAKVWSFATSSKGTVDIHFDGPVTFHTEDAQPAEKPSETCKWYKTPNGKINTHNKFFFSDREEVKHCPTCGLRIEVVE